MSKIKLPRTFTEEVWERLGKRPEWKKYIGLPSTSYSMLDSFDNYTNDAIKNYLFKIKEDIGPFAFYGSAVGEYFESIGEEIDTNWLSEDDVDYLSTQLFTDEKHEFERPIVIPIEIGSDTVVFYGFIDLYSPSGPSQVIDFKTGNIDRAAKKYKSNEYQQTRLYSYGLELEGITTEYCGVKLFGRKGDGDVQWGPLRLTGESKDIPTPYNKAETERYINDIMKPKIKTISDMYKSYLKIFG